MIRLPPLLAVLLAALAALLVACGDDDGEDTTTAAAGPDVERYCEISAQMDAAGREEFEALEQDPNATQEDFATAERQLVEENEQLIAEVQEVAPEQIQGDLEVLIQGLEVRAGLTDVAPRPSEEREADRALSDFEKENCPSGEPPAP